MQSKTSFFNRTVFRKTMSRFWPLWFIYTAVWILILPLQLAADRSGYWTALRTQGYLLDMAYVGSIVSGAIMGCVSAIAVWSFLYANRSAHGMACLPLRREGIFASVSLAGLVPVFAANALVALLTLGAMALAGCMELSSLLTWLATNCLCYLFFYGFALFCAQLTGNVLVLPILYVVLNFTVYVVIAIINALCQCFIYGAYSSSFNGTALLVLSPIVYMLIYCGTDAISTENPEGVYEIVGYSFHGWDMMAVYAVVGLVLAVCALLLYKRRRMVSAGDVVAINALKPVFKYCFTFGCALVLGWLLSYVLFGITSDGMGGMSTLLTMVACMLVGAFIGYFSAEMLIHKSFRVWQGKKWPGFGVSVLVIVALMFAAEFNLFGYETRIPDAEDVDHIVLYADGESMVIDQEENIAQFTAIHQSIVDNKDSNEALSRSYTNTSDTRSSGCHFRYFDAEGNCILSRDYNLYYQLNQPDTYEDVLSLQNLLNTPEGIADRKEVGFAITAETIIGASVDAVLPAEDCARLAGYEDVESFILGYYGNFSPERIADMSEEAKTENIAEYVQRYAYSWDYAEESTYTEDGKPYTVQTTEWTLDMDSLLFQWSWELTEEEAAELYNQCVLPDMADQTIGKIWLISGDSYHQSVYSATINIDARAEDSSGNEDSDGWLYHYFHTVPTVDSSRTNLWLAAHGVEMMTLAQLGLK